MGKVKKIIDVLYGHYDPVCSLEFGSDWQCLCSVMLSAQATDRSVNKATRQMYVDMPRVSDYATVGVEKIEMYINSVNYYHTKAKNIQSNARKIILDYGGEVPYKLVDLLSLAGVGRKTANVVLGTFFQKPVGVVVDTHVGRIARRLGLSKCEKPDGVEVDLMKKIPNKIWVDWSHLMIWHGREVCFARCPRCDVCPLLDLCLYGKNKMNINK